MVHRHHEHQQKQIDLAQTPRALKPIPVIARPLSQNEDDAQQRQNHPRHYAAHSQVEMGVELVIVILREMRRDVLEVEGKSIVLK